MIKGAYVSAEEQRDAFHTDWANILTALVLGGFFKQTNLIC